MTLPCVSTAFATKTAHLPCVLPLPSWLRRCLSLRSSGRGQTDRRRSLRRDESEHLRSLSVVSPTASIVIPTPRQERSAAANCRSARTAAPNSMPSSGATHARSVGRSHDLCVGPQRTWRPAAEQRRRRQPSGDAWCRLDCLELSGFVPSGDGAVVDFGLQAALGRSDAAGHDPEGRDRGR